MNNNQGITKIKFTKTIYPFCPLGGDFYRAEIEVTIFPNDELFDFCEIEKQIEKLSMESLIIEDVADAVYKIMLEYNPKDIKIVVNGYSNKHFPVEVTKE